MSKIRSVSIKITTVYVKLCCLPQVAVSRAKSSLTRCIVQSIWNGSIRWICVSLWSSFSFVFSRFLLVSWSRRCLVVVVARRSARFISLLDEMEDEISIIKLELASQSHMMPESCGESDIAYHYSKLFPFTKPITVSKQYTERIRHSNDYEANIFKKLKSDKPCILQLKQPVKIRTYNIINWDSAWNKQIRKQRWEFILNN